MKNIYRKLKEKLKTYLVGDLLYQQNISLLLLGKSQAERIKLLGEIKTLSEAEFRVFSQFGEDGIIQHIVQKIGMPNRTFVEIGVQNYTESNTRFLLLNDNWSGAVVDGSPADINYIKKDAIFWRHDLRAICQFVTKENINSIVLEAAAGSEIDILSIDVDGNDYWLWNELNAIQPRLVICEYNSLFGRDRAVTTPYSADFYRTSAHYSNLYFGASLPALYLLAQKKGYEFVGSNSAGNNAFFVRKDINKGLKVFSAQDGYVPAKFRESRNSSGKLTFLNRSNALNEIKNCNLVDVTNNQNILVQEIV